MSVSKIHILDAAVSNQIAAGEVVERPASVVKELVENSLDAGSTRVDVELEGHGQRLIRVTDDGTGMSPQDMALSVRRHATSKISSSAELMAIRSFGFRGEALPSIASVSRFAMASREASSQEAWQLCVTAGTEAALEPAALSQGTRIEVRDLFFNTPARLKFLKSPSTESGRVQLDILRLAIPQPQVAFSLRLDGKLSMEFPKVDSLAERLGQALGLGFLADSLAVDAQSGSLGVKGWAGRPGQHRSNRSGQHLFVNGRAVEHRLFGFTLSQAYGSLIPHGRHATAAIFVQIPGSEVDVNVHPAKRELRFRDERGVLDMIRRGVADALGKASLMATYVLPVSGGNAAADAGAEKGASGLPIQPWLDSPSRMGSFSAAAPHQMASPWASRPAPDGGGQQAPVSDDWPVPMAQLHRSYLLCQDSGGLVVVDQHAAHERVLYERLFLAMEKGDPKSQRLLLPQKLNLGPSQAERVRVWMGPLASMGLELQDLGGGVFYVLSIPAFMKHVQVTVLLQELLDELGDESEGDPMGAFRREVAAQMACRAAVKAGDPLNLDEMQGLMAELSRCEVPWSCPHGRPPFVRLPLAELEKYFERR
jgi:DNA mismatch repair protein MutL